MWRTPSAREQAAGLAASRAPSTAAPVADVRTLQRLVPAAPPGSRSVPRTPPAAVAGHLLQGDRSSPAAAETQDGLGADQLEESAEPSEISRTRSPAQGARRGACSRGGWRGWRRLWRLARCRGAGACSPCWPISAAS